MLSLLAHLRGAVVSTLFLGLACCGVYPLVVHALAQTLFPEKANGSLIVQPDGVVRGSTLLGQRFSGPGYFHGRPSAAGAGYDAASSSGSNLGPTSRKLQELIQERVAAYRATNGLGASDPVPADAVTASGSGLDPHISQRNAALQATRVARVRGLDSERVLALVRRCTDGLGSSLFGEPGVNVLRLNLALDELGRPGAAPTSSGTSGDTTPPE